MIKPTTETATQAPKLSKNEGLKETSNFLRGTILEGLADTTTGAISDDDTQLTKFHGIYQQDDRDLRSERRKQKLEKAFIFMVRVRVPGGICSSEQWLKMDAIADARANGTLKLTTRQAFQIHGVLKGELKPAIQDIDRACLDTIAACGDVNRNVMCNPNPYTSDAHAQAYELAKAISAHLTPATRAYHEIWLDGEKVSGGAEEEEPIYGKTYLPRKFKTVVAVPPSNDVDIFAHCLGFMSIVEDGQVVGYNVTVGGGMGMSHGKTETYPRLADVLGFCTPEQAVAVSEAVVKVQRDFGDRTDRKHARLKYTVEDLGLERFRELVETHLDFKLETARPYHFESNGDLYGWADQTNGRQSLTLFIENGRVRDDGKHRVKSGLRAIAEIHDGDFRLTPNQNLIIGNIDPANRPQIEQLLEDYGIAALQNPTGLRGRSMACVALPTCGLSLAESERYLPRLVDALDTVVESCGLREEEINIRMTGCPNGCARPYLGEIGFVGKAPGKYNVYLGAGFAGNRLNKLYRQSVKQEDIVPLLQPILEDYAKSRQSGERFGDFVIRQGYIAASGNGADFHANLPEAVKG
ncbi:MAG: NADPH-dependent assimilatory sulfite reductase hemoprotein subunit [Opitutales bacterium]